MNTKIWNLNNQLDYINNIITPRVNPDGDLFWADREGLWSLSSHTLLNPRVDNPLDKATTQIFCFYQICNSHVNKFRLSLFYSYFIDFSLFITNRLVKYTVVLKLVLYVEYGLDSNPGHIPPSPRLGS